MVANGVDRPADLSELRSRGIQVQVFPARMVGSPGHHSKRVAIANSSAQAKPKEFFSGASAAEKKSRIR